MAKKISENKNVAYFDESFVESGLVGEAGFYVVEKEANENTVIPHTSDGEEIKGASPVSLGVVLGDRVYPDTRPVERDDDGEITFEPESGWFTAPTFGEVGES